MMKGKIIFIAALFTFGQLCIAQNVEILSYEVNNFGQVQLEIESKADKYYTLTAQHAPNFDYESITSMTMGENGTMFISEPLAAYPIQNYSITEHSIIDPDDTDGDGIDDVTEYNNFPTFSPLNFAREIPFEDGVAGLNSAQTFNDLALISEDIPWAPFLNDQAFVKFAIVNQSSAEPEIYFINSKTHYIHADFLNTINVDQFGDDVVTGEIVYNPNVILPNGAFGSYSFNYSFGDAFSFADTRQTFELLARNMPFLQNNFQHFIGNGGESTHINIYKDDFEGSRINVVLESEFFADVDFLPFNQAEGFGFFRLMTLDENPGSRDIVLYDALPNSLPRVGGIMTSVIQTPLSHVNLRAIQDNVPNAYVKDPLDIDSIANLLGKYIYYKVEQNKYEIREASLEEVNAWYETIRPTEDQIPIRDLSQTKILPLDDIQFDMSASFGAKCANVATMRTFGFPEGTIPDGFGIPFYFYDEFMKYNGFYEKVETMISDPIFISDLETRIESLKDFRKEIKAAEMPQWMLDSLQSMHDKFPEGTAVRVRSSTNNEDLPGFSGAGLYTSKTQHLDEGHISKSVKQVYASMWNFRAYDERDFYRVDHYIAAMGLLCHPNFEDEKSNGVGVSIDPIYKTEGTFYLNTQVGESLITNPDANSVPEEILLSENEDVGYFVLRYSNLVENGELVMDESYLDLMRSYLRVIHDEFAILYNVVGAEGFGMDIEYKVTIDDRMIIKQARPWVSFWAEINATFDLGVSAIVKPTSSSTLTDNELITAKISNEGLRDLNNFEISLLIDDQVVETIQINEELPTQSSAEFQFNTPQDFSSVGDYNIGAIVSHPQDGYYRNDTLQTIISNLHLLEGGITFVSAEAKCDDEVQVIAQVSNIGSTLFNSIEIEVTVNGLIVDTVEYISNIPSFAQVNVPINITENLMQNDNIIILNLVKLNGQIDPVLSNNQFSTTVSLNSNYDYITLVINADDYPEETSWSLVDNNSGQIINTGALDDNVQIYSEDICLDYTSCYTFNMYDTYGDGICCFGGMGNFSILDNLGETLIYNDGNFGDQAEEIFCPSGDCLLDAEILTTNASNENTADGSILINTLNGVAPFQYSIDNGNTFFTTNEFFNLSPGEYMVIIMDGIENCLFEETITIGVLSKNVNIYKTNIKVYPNPTQDNIIIEVDQNAIFSDGLTIGLYNNLGVLIKKSRLNDPSSKTMISLAEYSAGSYVIKCFNKEIEQYYKIIKL